MQNTYFSSLMISPQFQISYNTDENFVTVATNNIIVITFDKFSSDLKFSILANYSKTQ